MVFRPHAAIAFSNDLQREAIAADLSVTKAITIIISRSGGGSGGGGAIVE